MESVRTKINKQEFTNSLGEAKSILPSTLFCTFILFFSVYSIKFTFMPSYFTPRIISIIIIIIISVYDKKKQVLDLRKIQINKYDLFWIMFILFQFIYTLLIYIYNNPGQHSTNDIQSALNFLIFVAILPIFAQTFFLNTRQFTSSLVMASVLHAMIIFMSFAFPSVRLWLESIQTFEMARYSWRIIGLGIVGAGGSVYLFCGLIANAYLLLFSNRNWIYIVTYLFIISAIALVGRTGFYIAVIMTLYVLFFNSINFLQRLFLFLKISVIIVVFIIAFHLIAQNLKDINYPLLEYTRNRIFEIFEEQNTVTALVKYQTSPELCFDTLIGTGIIRGTTRTGLLIQHDSGYVKRYASIGLVFSALSYIVFIIYVYYYALGLGVSKKYFILFCLSILLIIEIKEPFIYMLAYPFTIIMIAKLDFKDLKKYENR